MSTSRVPGITRNSGWQAVNAKIVEARTRSWQSESTAVDAEPRPEAGVWKHGDGGETEQGGLRRR